MDNKEKKIIKTNHFTIIWSVVKETLRKKMFQLPKKNRYFTGGKYLYSVNIKVHMYMYVKVYKNK